MKRSCVPEDSPERRPRVDTLPSPGASIRVADPYTRALTEDNKRLRSSLAHFTQKIANLEAEKSELLEKVKKLEAGVVGAPSNGATVHIVGNSLMRVPVPEAFQQSQQQQDEAKETNLNYLSNLNDDQVGGQRGERKG